MPDQTLPTEAQTYARDGFISPVTIMRPDEAFSHRDRLEAAEQRHGPMHYKTKVHMILTSPFELAMNARVLDVLVRGEDRYGFYHRDVPPGGDLEPAALARQRELEDVYLVTAGTA